MTTNPTVRASDAEREWVVELLKQQMALGRLTLEELQQRTSAAYDARTRPELEKLTEDLPSAGGRQEPVAVDHRTTARAPAWRAVLACCCGLARAGNAEPSGGDSSAQTSPALTGPTATWMGKRLPCGSV